MVTRLAVLKIKIVLLVGISARLELLVKYGPFLGTLVTLLKQTVVVFVQQGFSRPFVSLQFYTGLGRKVPPRRDRRWFHRNQMILLLRRRSVPQRIGVAVRAGVLFRSGHFGARNSAEPGVCVGQLFVVLFRRDGRVGAVLATGTLSVETLEPIVVDWAVDFAGSRW